MTLDNFYSFFVRPSSDKDIIQGNNDRMIFINSNFTLFYCNEKSKTLKKIGKVYKFKSVTKDICAYRPIDEDTNKPMN